MGIAYIRQVEGPAVIGVWEILEDAGELLEGIELSSSEKLLYGTFRTDSRRLQWLAYRRLIRELISPEKYPVHYDEAGKPYLAGSNWHISVTHTENYAGVILSNTVRVGIDMEKIRPRIERVKEKFLSDEELAAIPTVGWLEYLTLAWCAKEALYKLYGYRTMDFRKNLRVALPPSQEDGSFTGSVIIPGLQASYRLFHERHDDLFVVWAAEERKDADPL
jgi:4'-phosphopantetheinyl transferase